MAESDTLPQDDAARKMASPLLRKFEAMKAKHEEDSKERRESMRHTDHLTTERHASLSDLKEKHLDAVNNPASVSDEYRHTDHLTTERHASLSALKEKHIDAVNSAVGLTDEEIKARLSKKWENPSDPPCRAGGAADGASAPTAPIATAGGGDDGAMDASASTGTAGVDDGAVEVPAPIVTAGGDDDEAVEASASIGTAGGDNDGALDASTSTGTAGVDDETVEVSAPIVTAGGDDDEAVEASASIGTAGGHAESAGYTIDAADETSDAPGVGAIDAADGGAFDVSEASAAEAAAVVDAPGAGLAGTDAAAADDDDRVLERRAAAITTAPSSSDAPADSDEAQAGGAEPPDDASEEAEAGDGGGFFAPLGRLFDRIDNFTIESLAGGENGPLADLLSSPSGGGGGDASAPPAPSPRARARPPPAPPATTAADDLLSPKVVYCGVGLNGEVVAETIDPREATAEATGEAIRLGRHMIEVVPPRRPARGLLDRVLGGGGTSWDEGACGPFTSLKLLESDEEGGVCTFVVCFVEGELPMQDAVAFCEELSETLRSLLRSDGDDGESDELKQIHEIDAPMLTDILRAEVSNIGFRRFYASDPALADL